MPRPWNVEKRKLGVAPVGDAFCEAELDGCCDVDFAGQATGPATVTKQRMIFPPGTELVGDPFCVTVPNGDCCGVESDADAGGLVLTYQRLRVPVGLVGAESCIQVEECDPCYGLLQCVIDGTVYDVPNQITVTQFIGGSGTVSGGALAFCVQATLTRISNSAWISDCPTMTLDFCANLLQGVYPYGISGPTPILTFSASPAMTYPTVIDEVSGAGYLTTIFEEGPDSAYDADYFNSYDNLRAYPKTLVAEEWRDYQLTLFPYTYTSYQLRQLDQKIFGGTVQYVCDLLPPPPGFPLEMATGQFTCEVRKYGSDWLLTTQATFIWGEATGEGPSTVIEFDVSAVVPSTCATHPKIISFIDAGVDFSQQTEDGNTNFAANSTWTVSAPYYIVQPQVATYPPVAYRPRNCLFITGFEIPFQVRSYSDPLYIKQYGVWSDTAPLSPGVPKTVLKVSNTLSGTLTVFSDTSSGPPMRFTYTVDLDGVSAEVSVSV